MVKYFYKKISFKIVLASDFTIILEKNNSWDFIVHVLFSVYYQNLKLI